MCATTLLNLISVRVSIFKYFFTEDDLDDEGNFEDEEEPEEVISCAHLKKKKQISWLFKNKRKQLGMVLLY